MSIPKIQAIGDDIIVETLKDTDLGGIVLPETYDVRGKGFQTYKAKVLSVGNRLTDWNGKLIANPPKPGDTVLISRDYSSVKEFRFKEGDNTRVLQKLKVRFVEAVVEQS